MYPRATASLLCLATLVLPGSTRAQTTGNSTAEPTITAEHEPWYLSGEPLTYDGYSYYPIGALTAFNRNEMVRSGFYRGIPLYARTTIEPWSVVYVPVAGGFMQPYVRRRSGEIGGTIGSTSPGLPIERGETSRALTRAPHAPGPPMLLQETPIDRVPGAAPEPAPVGTTARVAPQPATTVGSVESSLPSYASRVVVLPRPRPLITAARPTGANGTYVEFDSARWYSSGSTLELDSSFHRIGEYHGFPVYARDENGSMIYIPVTSTVRTLVAPYSKRR